MVAAVRVMYGTGSGMNLMDLKTKDWWHEALDVSYGIISTRQTCCEERTRSQRLHS